MLVYDCCYELKVLMLVIYVVYFRNPQVDIQAMARVHRIGQVCSSSIFIYVYSSIMLVHIYACRRS